MLAAEKTMRTEFQENRMKMIGTIVITFAVLVAVPGCKRHPSAELNPKGGSDSNNAESTSGGNPAPESPTTIMERNIQSATGCSNDVLKLKDGGGYIPVVIGVHGASDHCLFNYSGEEEFSENIAPLWAGAFGWGFSFHKIKSQIGNSFTVWGYGSDCPETSAKGNIETNLGNMQGCLSSGLKDEGMSTDDNTTGVDPSLIKGLMVVYFDSRTVAAKHDEFGHEIRPNSTEYRLVRKLTLSPGEARKFQWESDYIHGVWPNVLKKAAAAVYFDSPVRKSEWTPTAEINVDIKELGFLLQRPHDSK
jgi:hypothetical protein